MTGLASTPHLLPENRIPLYYSGGPNITTFRGGGHGGQGPEDWIASLRTLPESLQHEPKRPQLGLSTLETGVTLKAAIEDDRVGWLGTALAEALGPSSGLLVKLLDAGERLPFHYHPPPSFAQANLGSIFGKTEGWIVVAAPRDASLWLGFRQEMMLCDVRELVQSQDASHMLETMVQHQANAGDVFFVPGGVPHALGKGIMVAELQEPTGFSILLEYQRFGMTVEQATLALGWDKALGCLDRRGYGRNQRPLRPTPRTILSTHNGQIEQLFHPSTERFFQAERVAVTGTLPLPGPRFAVVLILSGDGILRHRHGAEPIASGQTWVVPHGAGAATLEGELHALLCLPPVVDGAK